MVINLLKLDGGELVSFCLTVVAWVWFWSMWRKLLTISGERARAKEAREWARATGVQ
jgi:hypothetical protein